MFLARSNFQFAKNCCFLQAAQVILKENINTYSNKVFARDLTRSTMADQQVIIGITGTNGAGKGTVVDFLVQKFNFSISCMVKKLS